MERLKERFAVARRALSTLEEVLAIPRPSRIERDAAIQRFEYTFEACWRAVQRYLMVAEGGERRLSQGVRSGLQGSGTSLGRAGCDRP